MESPLLPEVGIIRVAFWSGRFLCRRRVLLQFGCIVPRLNLEVWAWSNIGDLKLPVPVLKGKNGANIQHQYW